MDESELVNRLRGLALAEPALGIDPDEVATRAARRLRQRRATMGAVVAVVALAAAVVAASATNLTGAEPADIGPPISTEFPSPQPDPTDPHDLSGAAGRNRAHLRQVIGTVLPATQQVSVGDFKQYNRYDVRLWAQLISQVEFTDDAGPAAFYLEVAGPGVYGTADTACNPNLVGRDGKPAVEATLPDGKHLRCDTIPQPGGSTLVLGENGEPGATEHTLSRVSGLYALLYRSDGSVVGLSNDDKVSNEVAERFGQPNPGGTRSRFPLTEQQMIALVTDPAFTLR
ncbi:MAG TPA: hypothetical protein VGR06_10515 [Actinophytocola sp.]|jgi:hypothetical protein|uniref:hypothetical protein n=1 Tax=Actinophytocola sp. TaxID=1872138 RepID=UPI002E04E0BC|nr:hypothetical protein [Actinophytocola sp.]